jgi:hypothetical protein
LINFEGGFVMKKSLLFVAAFFMLQGTALADDEVKTVETVVALNGAYVPGGFDSQSDVFVIVSGMFPNTCYTWNQADVSHEQGSDFVDVVAKANVTQGVTCMRVLVPYQKEVYIGRLEPGDYTLRFANGDGTYFYEPLHIEQ